MLPMRNEVEVGKEMTKMIQFDSYTWKARVLPVFIVLLPVGIATVLWLPSLLFAERLAGALAGPFGLAMLLSQIGRDRGYRKQTALWELWGGAPTTQLLRHRTPGSNPITLNRYHQKLRLLTPDLNIPSREEEVIDPQQADHAYAACVQFLISQTRDRSRFPLLYKENVNYGLRRNIWGIKPFGLALSVLCLIAAILRFWFVWGTPAGVTGELIASLALSLVLLLFWMLWVTPAWVRIPATGYAERLLECCEHLEPVRPN
jgi:hypothetical protein